jgi:SAM-dependent methyltransferase
MATLFGKTIMKMLPAKSLRRALVRVASDKLKWKLALPCEEKYWEEYISQKGGTEYSANFAERMNPQTPLQAHVRCHINAPEGSTVKILDVGAGPLTVLGKTWPERKIEITAVDPLANDYARLLRKHNVTPPVQTAYCAAEQLSSRFNQNQFDLVYSRNALDHSYNPVEAIWQMLGVCKPGCVVLLQHLINEGETEKYYGLHQWNFNLENGRFIIWNKIRRSDVADEIGASASVAAIVEGKWLTVAITKSAV